MTQILCNGDPYSYAQFRIEAIKPRRTERTQRKEIDDSIDLLAKQHDYWSLEVIRKIATALSDDTDTDAGNNLLFLLRKVIYAKPEEWIIERK